MSEVYFGNMRAEAGLSLLDKVETLFDRAGFAECFGEGEFVALKVHFGDRGNTAFVRPIYVRRLVDKVKQAGGKPFLTDANTLYVGTRSNAVDHLKTAIENGFTYSVVDAPLVIADGLNGKDYVEVEVKQKHFSEVKIASAAYQADALIAISHFKGHEMTGFGGTLKNIGMGLGSRSAKQMMHSDVKPQVDLEKCIGCEKCLQWCPAEAISMVGEKVQIDYEKCLGCGECIVTCPEQAMAISWESDVGAMQEKMVEYAYGVLQNKQDKAGFFNFLIGISPDCDCWGYADAPIVSDIGILASKDPVAIDQASIDLVNQQEGLKGTALSGKALKAGEKFGSIWPGADWQIQLKYAEQLGLGSRQYSLTTID